MTKMTPEAYALQLLRDGATPRQAADQSGLEVAQVVVALLTDWRKTPTTAEYPLAEYLEHPSAKVRKAAERLRDVHETEDRKADLLRRRQALEDELAAVKAQLRGGQQQGTHQCPDCGMTVASAQGLAVHRARKHKQVAS